MKRLLELKHEDYPDSWERWHKTDNDPDEIFVVFDCPQNWPDKGSHSLSVMTAMKQYCLMTSTEGWYVSEDTGWHDFIEAYQVPVA